MSGRIKHMERSHYSYRTNNAANVFAGFEHRAVVKSNNQAMRKAGPSFINRVKDGIRKMLHRDQSK